MPNGAPYSVKNSLVSIFLVVDLCACSHTHSGRPAAHTCWCPWIAPSAVHAKCLWATREEATHSFYMFTRLRSGPTAHAMP